MNKKSILFGSMAGTGLFLILFLASPVFSHSGYGSMMGGYNNQYQRARIADCPIWNEAENGNFGNGGMMNGWR